MINYENQTNNPDNNNINNDDNSKNNIMLICILLLLLLLIINRGRLILSVIMCGHYQNRCHSFSLSRYQMPCLNPGSMQFQHHGQLKRPTSKLD